MSERLRSVGLDVGTTSTQMVVSELHIENRASAFAVPEMEIVSREVRYRSPVHFTPLLDESHVDRAAIRQLVEQEYRNAGICRKDVDTGAIIITGETSRKENARAVLDALSDLAGEFVVATAGPELESILAAKGAGAVDYSRKTGKTVLHMDIGGGTSNLALIRDGKILRTGCMNVGGRLLKFGKDGCLTYRSPVLQSLFPAIPGEKPPQERIKALAGLLAEALEMAAGLRQPTPLLPRLWTEEAGQVWEIPQEEVTLSFSGGVADCIDKVRDPLDFGDMGPLLGRAIRASRLCRGDYRLGQETIRATVIGAGCHSTQLSGSTVFHQNVQFPLKNIPVTDLSRLGEPAEGPVFLSGTGIGTPTYRAVASLAERIAREGKVPIYLCLEQDMAKALGQALALRLPMGTPILCIDRVKAAEGSYLDVGAPTGSALPVVVKTLVLGG